MARRASQRAGESAGTCDARFAAVAEAFLENFAHRRELGAGVAVIVDGRPVVELWGGWADADRSRAWQQDTVVNVFSVGKAVATLCVLMLVSRGALDLDEPVSRWWPEFAAAGKERITVRQVLSHQAGLAALARELPDGSLYDWAAVTDALAEQEPWWTPGKGHGYHVHTFGFLAGEIVRRVAGEPIGAFLRREVAGALGVDMSFGLARSDRSRRAEYVFDFEHVSRADRGERAVVDVRLRERAYLNPPGATGIGTVNTAAWQDAELPSANLHAGPLAIARLYDALISDAPLLINREVLVQATAEAASGDDLVLGRPSRFGLGFQLTQPERPLGPNPSSFGHFGTGGSLGFADPEARVAFAYVMNRGGPQWQDPRNRALIDAVYAALGDE
jgi:CubicO group peptidase (beta-lactamase class C family)